MFQYDTCTVYTSLYREYRHSGIIEQSLSYIDAKQYNHNIGLLESKQKYKILCYIHGYCSLIGSCSMLIGNESRYLETFMIYCKHGRLCVSLHTTIL